MIDQGYALIGQGAFGKAVEVFTASIDQQPDAAPAWRGRGTAKLQLQQWDEAEMDFRRAAALSPEDPETWIGLAMSLALQFRVYPAIEVLEALEIRHPDFARASIQLGLLYLKVGAIRKGREKLQAVLRQDLPLEERRFVEDQLKKQEVLDVKRFYRPDFAALRKGAV